MPQPIQLAVTRTVKPGREREFERQLALFAQLSLAEPGARWVQLLYPAPGSGSLDYGILRTFANATDRDKFYQSPLYLDWVRTIEPLVEGEPKYRELHGLEAWFRHPHNHEPPAWKMALATYLGVVPVVMFLAVTLGRWLDHWDFVVRNFVFNAFVVVLLTWVVMPLITRSLHDWLYQTKKDPSYDYRNHSRPDTA